MISMNLLLTAGATVLAPAITGAPNLAPMALNSLSTSPAKIAGAMVENPHGEVIGHVRAVATGPGGKPTAISVMTAKGVVVVAAGAASYDESRNLVVADLPAPQVASTRH